MRARWLHKVNLLDHVHFSISMSESSDKCMIEFIQDPVTVWKMKLKGDCSKELELVDSMPKGKKRYLEKRLEVID